MTDSPEAVLALANAATDEYSFDATLQQVVDLASVGVGGCSMAGITLLQRSGPTTAVATSPAAARVDAIQYKVNSGPCLDAYRRQVVNQIDSTSTDKRWPEFCEGAAAEGVRSTLSFPLIVSGDGIGALNLYSETENGFDEQDLRSGAVFAAHASVTLGNARAYWRTEVLRRNLEEALQSRGVIDQAKGILMAREGYTADEAFEILRRASQRSNRKVRDLATEIVDGSRRDRDKSTP
jgi:transcriptional regulator with GAF, ATPase, and Fis domain